MSDETTQRVELLAELNKALEDLAGAVKKLNAVIATSPSPNTYLLILNDEEKQWLGSWVWGEATRPELLRRIANLRPIGSGRHVISFTEEQRRTWVDAIEQVPFRAENPILQLLPMLRNAK